MLWAEGMSKEERNVFSGELKRLTIAIPFEEKLVEGRDKEDIKQKPGEVKASLWEMVTYLKSKGYLKASGIFNEPGKGFSPM